MFMTVNDWKTTKEQRPAEFLTLRKDYSAKLATRLASYFESKPFKNEIWIAKADLSQFRLIALADFFTMNFYWEYEGESPELYQYLVTEMEDAGYEVTIGAYTCTGDHPILPRLDGYGPSRTASVVHAFLQMWENTRD